MRGVRKDEVGSWHDRPMSESVHNVPAAELVEKLAEFSKWRVENLDGDEKGEAQVFLDRLFRALGWPGVFEAGAKLEFRIAKEGGGKSFADLLWKPRVLIEMKKAGEDLASHYHQAFNYWIRAVPDRPRYVVLCNFDEFWIYDFENQVDQPVEKIQLDRLADHWESIGFMLPDPIRPVLGKLQKTSPKCLSLSGIEALPQSPRSDSHFSA
jgi:hypothetical protein